MSTLGTPFSLTPAPFSPDRFQLRLEEVFGRRFRIRWSLRKGAWHIEQRVGRAALAPLRIAEWDDSLIRARDGYALVMEVRPGTTMPCPFCHGKVEVAV